LLTEDFIKWNSSESIERIFSSDFSNEFVVSDFNERLLQYKSRVDKALDHHLPSDSHSTTLLLKAMRYAITNGGKRVRPVITYATGAALGIPLDRLDVVACSVEMMHAYSLVHDDLPAMDDDDLRRGLPTLHKKFDEATAILAGDALQALAFTVLATNKDTSLTADARLQMIAVLGEASGANGMAAGQAIDLEAVGKTLTLEQLEDMHRHKTGALIRASARLAVLVANAANDTLSAKIDAYADAIGLSFQIVDDILDITGDTETLGKTQGADLALNKPTYPALLGLEGAKKYAQNMHNAALDSLAGLGNDFDELRELSGFIVNRSN